MEENYLQGIWTRYGLERMAAWAVGGDPVTIVEAALGSGGGKIPEVTPIQSALNEEVFRGAVNSVQINPEDPTDIIVDLIVPNDVGGFWIREWGLYDDHGSLVAVGPHDEMHKPHITSGQAAEFLERFHLPVSNSGAITLVISSNALATQEYTEHAITLAMAGLEARLTMLLRAVQTFATYTIPVTDPSGLARVRLADLGHPEQPGPFNPIINLLTASPYTFCVTGRSGEEFTVQVYRLPEGTPGVNIVRHIELGTFELGDGFEVGADGAGAGLSDVTLLVSIPT
jgi:hypothetical protein